MINFTHIIIHHSYTVAGSTVSWDDIKRYHTSWRYNDEIITKEQAEKLISEGKNVLSPWSDIGYHFGVEMLKPRPVVNDGTNIVVTDPPQLFFQFGRKLDFAGAHAVGFNSIGIGVCAISQYDTNMPSQEVWSATLAISRGLMVKYNIKPANVLGHWETFILRGEAKTKEEAQKIKSCPGKLWDMDRFRSDLGIWTV